MTPYTFTVNGEDCEICGLRSFDHVHPDKTKPLEFILEKEMREKMMDEKGILKAAKESSCLQRIQMIVWKFMEQPQQDRNSVKMAEEIFEDVKETLEKQTYGSNNP